ncbi:MAG: hypothetical protein Q4E24_12770 [bacterium]|nr:hypothetical protein [bacterium]
MNEEPKDTVRAKRGRPKKKPGYDRDKVMDNMLQEAIKLFKEPYDDRQNRSPDAPTLVDVAEAMQTTTLKVRKILVTVGYYSTETSRKVQELYNSGYSVPEIMKETGLSKASVNTYLPYSKGAYKLEEPTLYAEQKRLYRKRETACRMLHDHLDSEDAEEYLWEAIIAFEGYAFLTEKGLSFKYKVKGGEVFFSRKAKSVTKASVMKAFHKAKQLQKIEGCVSGPKLLGTFGASYLYPVFLRIGVCKRICDD